MSDILIFSDIHIHNHKNSFKRLEHCLETLDWVFSTACTKNIDNVIFLGDLFQDREKIQVMPYQKTYEIINNYFGEDSHYPNMKLWLLIGNHDMWYANKADISSVYPYGSIKNVNIVHKPCKHNIGGLDIDFLPFTLNPVEVISKNFPSRSKILCGHIAIDGAQLNTLYKTKADVSVEYDGDMVKVSTHLFSSWDWVFLGHYHGAQILDNVEYVGSPLQLNFAEAFQKKHVIVLNTETLTKEYIDNEFSPKHYIVRKQDIDKYDLNNSFIKFLIDDMSTDEIVDMKRNLLEEGALTFEITAPNIKNETEQKITTAKNILSKEIDDMLKAYVDAVGTDGLERDKLLEIANKIYQKSKIE